MHSRNVCMHKHLKRHIGSKRVSGVLCAMMCFYSDKRRVGKIDVCSMPPPLTTRTHGIHLSPAHAANRVAAVNPPMDDTDPIRKFSIDPGIHTKLQNPAEFSPKGKPIRNFSIDPTSSIRTRLRTPFLRTPFCETSREGPLGRGFSANRFARIALICVANLRAI